VEHAIFIGFLFLASWLFALLEIQIEGRYGWAENLPTWRIENKWTRTFYRKPITGYHLYAQGFILLMAHAPFGLNMVPWNFHYELRILAFVVLFWILEDFFWFICNRDYGFKNFNPQCISWHRDSWWWVAPREYWLGTPLGIVLYLIGSQ
jgi:hypothetical protein